MSGFIFTLLKENKYPLKNQRLKSNTYTITKGDFYNPLICEKYERIFFCGSLPINFLQASHTRAWGSKHVS